MNADKYISIHALREEGDKALHPQQMQGKNFYPRPPRGGRQEKLRLLATTILISIHALREEGDLIGAVRVFVCKISIHALREEGDWQGYPMHSRIL